MHTLLLALSQLLFGLVIAMMLMIAGWGIRNAILGRRWAKQDRMIITQSSDDEFFNKIEEFRNDFA